MSDSESLEGIELEQDDDGPVFTSHRAAFDHAIATAPHLPRDLAAVHLGRAYADMLDDAMDRLTERAEEGDDESRDFGRVIAAIARIGPRYEAVLDKLGMSPGARPAIRGGEPHGVDPAAAALAELRDDAGGAAAGVDYAAGLDPATAEALADE